MKMAIFWVVAEVLEATSHNPDDGGIKALPSRRQPSSQYIILSFFKFNVGGRLT
jgi:hypothetical protein